MRRRDHPSFPSEITCCFVSVLKTLLMPSEPIRARSGVNVPGFPMAGFQLTLYGRIWAIPEGWFKSIRPDQLFQALTQPGFAADWGHEDFSASASVARR